MTEHLTTDPGYRLTYIVNKEAYYARPEYDEAVSVVKAADDGGCDWEFQIVNRPRIGLRMEMFDDAFISLTELPQLFAELAHRRPQSLQAVRELLDDLGFTDATQRVGPARQRRCSCGCPEAACQETS